MDNHKQKSPYKGLVIVALFWLGFPALVYAVMYYAFTSGFQATFDAEMCRIQALAVAGIVGFLFSTILLIGGAFKESFKVTHDRLKEFFEDVGISFKMACKWYFYRVKTEGLVFPILLLMYLANLFIAVYGCVKFAIIYI